MRTRDGILRGMDQRADRIIESAIALADKGGFQAVRLRDVAKDAGVAMGTLYARFRSKEDILVAALESQVEGFEKVIHEYAITGESELDRVTTFFTLATRALIARPQFAQAVLRSVSSGVPEVADKVLRFRHRVTTLVVASMRGRTPREVLEEDGVDGAAEVERRVAFLLQQVWFANLIVWMGGSASEEDIVAETAAAAELLLAGARAL